MSVPDTSRENWQVVKLIGRLSYSNGVYSYGWAAFNFVAPEGVFGVVLICRNPA
jgi:uncharacterized membrane protein HdeD (DUF308 family)